MGNSGDNPKITEQFKQSCHPGLHCCAITKDRNLYFPIELTPGVKAWWNTVQPLMKQAGFHQKPGKINHIFVPTSIEQMEPDVERGGCFNMGHSDYNQGKLIHIYYETFIYTLSREIDSRKANDVHFQQWEVWKIMKNICKAIVEWNTIYAGYNFGNITPENVILNHKGQIKLVCQLSFPVDYTQPINTNKTYLPNRESQIYSPNQTNPTIVLRPEPYIGCALENAALTILEVMTLQRFPNSSMSKTQKRNFMMDDSRYDVELRNLIWEMLQQKVQSRPSLDEVLHICRKQEKQLKKGLGSDKFAHTQ